MKKIKMNLTLLAITGVTLIAMFTVQSCSKSSSSSSAPVLIGGYASSDSVASSNLVAYFPFDGNANDTKGGSTATASSAVTFVTGVRGMAYQGAKSAYATLTPSTAFSSLSSFSLSVWYYLPALPIAGDPGGMFFLAGTNTLNEMILEADIPSTTQMTTDSVKIHHGFTDLGSPGWQGFTLESYDTMALGKWVHLVMTYDGGSSTYTFYQNGIPTGVSSAWSSGKYLTPTTIYDGPLPLGSGTPPTTVLGNNSFTSDPPKQIVIGTWPATLYGVSATLGANGCFLGKLDELRVFNRALTQAEVAGLFLNGQAGR